MGKRLALGIIILLLAVSGVGSLPVNPPEALASSPFSSYPDGVLATETLHPELLTWSEETPWDVLVLLKEQVDTPKVAAAAQAQGGAWAKGRLHRLLVRQKVVSALQDTAQRSQTGPLGILAAAKRAGQVEEYQSFFVVNALHVVADATVIRALANHPGVARITPNPVVTLSEMDPMDTVSPSGGMTYRWNHTMIGADSAWANHQTRGSGIVIGIIDTGVDWQHPALKARWRGYNPLDPDDPEPYGNWYDAVYPNNSAHALPVDLHGHGTHVTGIAVGYDPHANVLVGVAPEARWIAVNAFNVDGSASGSHLLAAGEYMLAPRDQSGTPRPDWAPDIINNSWGAKDTTSEFLRGMVQNWRSAGMVPVFAAGNSGPGTNSIQVPGGYPESFAVGMVNQARVVKAESSRGPGHYNGFMKPDVSAPGVEIYSCKVGGGYIFATGTSMAAPHVAGAAALILAKYPDLTVTELEQVLESTAWIDPATYATGPNPHLGWGIINADHALNGLKNGYWTLTYASQETELVDGQRLPAVVTLPAAYGYPVKRLAAQALKNKNLTEIQLPTSLEGIGAEALAQNQLAAITLPDGFLSLGAEALRGNRLSSVVFPQSIASIGSLALADNRLNPADLTVYGYAGTVAKSYALAHGHTFINLGPVTVSLQVSPAAGGTASGGGIYPQGSTVTLQAQPAPYYHFSHWQEDGLVVCEDSQYIFSAAVDRQLTAYFTPNTYLISGTVLPQESGTVTGLGTYEHGAAVTLTGFPQAGYRFRAWEEGSTRVRDNPYGFMASGDRNLNALFRESMDTRRLAGGDRYETAVAISQDGWPGGSDYVVLARGDDFADALSGAPLAYHLDAPILLTHPQALNNCTRSEVLRLGAQEVILLGGTAAINSQVESALLDMGLTVVRLAGTNRYETAAAMARELSGRGGVCSTVVLAVGTDFPDALAVSAYAARAGMPILLTRSLLLPDATQSVLDDLEIENVLVIGGMAVVSSAVYDSLPQGPLTQRIFGANRYETAVALAQYFQPGSATMAIATGLNFPDALAGGVWAARKDQGILLVNGQGSRPSQGIENYLVDQGISQVVLLGGTGAISSILADWF